MRSRIKSGMTINNVVIDKNGFTKRLMAVYEGAEEILVGSCDHSAVVTRIFNCDRWWILNRTVYLYIVLMKSMNCLYSEMPMSHSCEAFLQHRLGRNLVRVLQKNFQLINDRDSGHTPRNDLK